MKKILIAILIATMSLLTVGSAVLADAPTTTIVTWVGGGVIGGTVTSGNDNVASFGVNAAGANGVFTVTDSNNNPYGYNVDTVNAYIQSNVTNGSTWFQTDRIDSYTPMYGVAGQTVYAFVGSSGTGSMATGSGTNYAAMGNGTYGQPHTAGGFNFEANGSSYQILEYLGTSSGNYAQFDAQGNGTAVIDCMTTGGSGAGNINFGWGGGCYTNADATFTGIGSFAVDAVGSNSITTPIAGASGAMVAGGWTANGDGTLNSVSYHVIANFVAGATISNYSVTVH